MIAVTAADARAGFFDREKVLRAVDKAQRKVFSKFGAFTRKRAKSSIRKRKKISALGSAPSSHTGTLKKLIYFSYDATKRSVVIGPTLFRQDSKAPSLLEFGGTTTITPKRRKVFIARYKPRPFMGPAFQAELPGLPAMWKDSVK